jgi:hypothetical protein
MTPSAPTKAQALMALAQRLESEEPSGRLWCDALYATLPLDATEAIAKLNDESEMRFIALTKIGAWRDAAAMLMPEDGRTEISFVMNEAGNDEVTIVDIIQTISWGYLGNGRAEGPHAEARARLAAALRARAATSEGV